MAGSLRWSLALLVWAASCLTGSLAFAGDPPPPGAPPAPPPAQPPGTPPATPPPATPATPSTEDEPELTGDAKDKYQKEMKANLDALKNEKNKEIVRGTIGRLGSSATRAGRDALMVYAAGNKNQEFVTEAFKALSKIGNKKAIEFLCGKYALKSGDFLVQQSAADALGEAKSPLAVGPLLDVLTAPSTKIELTGSVSRAVARTAPKDDRVVETLFKLADGVKDTIRANAMEALGYVGSDKAMEKLKTALFDDKNTRVRGAAATGMKNSGRKDMIPVLERALAADKSMTVKDEIETALKALEGR